MEKTGVSHQKNTEQTETRDISIYNRRALEEAYKRCTFLAPFRAHRDTDAKTLGLEPGDYGNNAHVDTYQLCD